MSVVLQFTNDSLQKRVLTAQVFDTENLRNQSRQLVGVGLNIAETKLTIPLRQRVGNIVQVAPPFVPGSLTGSNVWLNRFNVRTCHCAAYSTLVLKVLSSQEAEQ